MRARLLPLLSPLLLRLLLRRAGRAAAADVNLSCVSVRRGGDDADADWRGDAGLGGDLDDLDWRGDWGNAGRSGGVLPAHRWNHPLRVMNRSPNPVAITLCANISSNRASCAGDDHMLTMIGCNVA